MMSWLPPAVRLCVQVAYLCGVPVTAYSLDLGKEHTDLLDAKLQRKMMTPGPAGKIAASDIDLLAVIAMAGVAAEGMSYEQVTGQNADLFLLQKILNKSQDKLPAAQQQTITRWAVCTPHTRHEGERGLDATAGRV
jgi:hypothetical protein